MSGFGEYSIYGSSSFATYVYLYVFDFDRSNPTTNLVGQGQSDDNGQLQFTSSLQGSSQLLKRVCIRLIFYMTDSKQANDSITIYSMLLEKSLQMSNFFLRHHPSRL